MVNMLQVGQTHVLSKYGEAAETEEGGELSVGCEDIENGYISIVGISGEVEL